MYSISYLRIPKGKECKFTPIHASVGGSRAKAPLILILGEWSASGPGRCTYEEEFRPPTPFIGG